MPEPVTILGVSGGILGLGLHLARRYYDAAKEVIDISLGFICWVIVLPVMIVAAILIKISDGGPIFFSQVRIGRNGKLFTIYKLRTMFADAEIRSGAVWAQRGDPRVMPLCRWMRRSHVDELPQLLNVIKGEMSLVGPRPERPELMAELEKHYPDVRKRLAVKPGITGLAQIRNGYDSTVDAFRHKLAADLEYISRRTWILDLSIMARTLARVNDKDAN